MTELDLYKFVNNNSIEWHVDQFFSGRKDEIIMFVDMHNIKEFNEMLGYNILDEEGITCVMKHGYFCFEMNDICEYFDIEPGNVFIEENE